MPADPPGREASPIRFGTDGLRGRAGDPPLDRPTLRRVGAALGTLLEKQGPPDKRVLIGHDGRGSAGWIRDALVIGLAGADAHCVDVGLCTTPALAFLADHEPCAAAIMISASHNPPEDNGIKIFGHDGSKLPDSAERELETLIAILEPAPEATGRARPRRELVDRYVEHVAGSVPGLDLTGTRLVVDAANGGGSEVAPTVLRGLGAEVIAIGCEPDGSNINRACGALHPESLAARVLAEKAHLGIALDGDGDRGIFVDETGVVRDGDAVLVAMALALADRGALPHRKIAATVMSNLGLHSVLREHGIEVLVTPVGDKNVVQAMRAHGLALGGEQSGHIVFAGPGRFSGDGLFTALQLLALPAARSSGFAALLGRMRRFPQVLINVRVGTKPPLEQLAAVTEAKRRVEAELGQSGRVLLRYSGTEDLCRVMVEGPDERAVAAHADTIAAAVRQALPE